MNATTPTELFAFRQPPAVAPPSASPLLASILLAIALCRSPEQLAAWWDWPSHRDARWHLTAQEQAHANAARLSRMSTLETSG